MAIGLGLRVVWWTGAVVGLGSGGATMIGILRGGLGKMLLVVGAESIGDCAWLGVINEADQSPQGGVYGAVGGQKLR